MSVPSTAELVSGFWAGSYPSGPVDAYALAAHLLGRNAAGYGVEAPLLAWTIRADDRLTPGTDGRPTYGYPVPSGAPVWVAYDLNGGKILASGPDFTVSDGYVWFEQDPIQEATVKGHVWTDSEVVPTAILFYSTGRPIPDRPSQEAGTYPTLVEAISVACDSPATGSTVETVQALWTGPDARVRVITDVAAYRLPSNDAAGVVVGQVLPPYTAVGTAWTLTKLGYPYPDLTGITLPATFFPGSGVVGAIRFYNHNVPTIVDTVSGRTRVRWNLGGTLSDVNALWASGQAWGVGAGARTLAQALDTRTNPTTEPTVVDIQTTINPFEFVCREIFSSNAFLLVVDATKFGPNAISDAARAKSISEKSGPYAAVVEWSGGAQPTPVEVTPT